MLIRLNIAIVYYYWLFQKLSFRDQFPYLDKLRGIGFIPWEESHETLNVGGNLLHIFQS